MPPIECDPATLDEAYARVSPSIVSVNGYDRANYTLDFTTGFIIYSDRKSTLICVHQSVVRGKKSLYVHFSDGVTEKAEVFLSNAPAEHVVLSVNSTGGRARPAVRFSRRAAKREEVFTISEIQGGYFGFNMMTGTVCIPECTVRDSVTRKLVRETKLTFAMSCPAVSWPHDGRSTHQVIGAAVFDLTDYLVIGTIKSLDARSYDIKYTTQSHYWVTDLQELLKDRDKRISLMRGKCKKKGGPGPSAAKASPGPSAAKASPGQSAAKKRKRTKEVKMAAQTSKSSRRKCTKEVKMAVQTSKSSRRKGTKEVKIAGQTSKSSRRSSS